MTYYSDALRFDALQAHGCAHLPSADHKNHKRVRKQQSSKQSSDDCVCGIAKSFLTRVRVTAHCKP